MVKLVWLFSRIFHLGILADPSRFFVILSHQTTNFDTKILPDELFLKNGN